MVAVGDRIVVESERVGQAAREGVILEILPSVSPGGHFLVEWEDGRTSDIRPAAGSARFIAAAHPVATKRQPGRESLAVSRPRG